MSSPAMINILESCAEMQYDIHGLAIHVFMFNLSVIVDAYIVKGGM